MVPSNLVETQRTASHLSSLFPFPSPLAWLSECGFYEITEQRMWIRWARLELRVKLAPQKPRVPFPVYLDDLNQMPIREDTTEDHPCRCQLIDVSIIEFVPMPVSFVDELLAIGLRGVCTRSYPTRIGAQPHGTAQI